MIRVLVDGRIDGADGIGRYTRCLTAALRGHPGRAVHVEVLPPTGTPRYGRGEGAELSRAARACGADVIHVLDYRVPLEDPEVPLVATIHDTLRLTHPEHCYGDDEFADLFGVDGLAELHAATRALRGLGGYPAGAARQPRRLHEEFYARMLGLACARAARVVVPTRTVARQLEAGVGRRSGVRVSPWGVDHLDIDRAGLGPSPARPLATAGRYLLYVGQARSHKGLPALLDGYRRSRAPRAGVRLVCAGRDFTAGAHGARLLADRLGEAAVAIGAVSDAVLATLYTHAEGLIHLAEYEGFGFTPLEAMAAGTRVIVSDIPVLRENLGAHAVFVDPADPEAVTQAIDNLIAAPDGPTAKRRRARWTRRYRWHHHARDVLTLYTEVVR